MHKLPVVCCINFAERLFIKYSEMLDNGNKISALKMYCYLLIFFICMLITGKKSPIYFYVGKGKYYNFESFRIYPKISDSESEESCWVDG